MSELGNLSQCMVDGDQAAKARARGLRRKALAVSVALEAVVIAGAVLWPLMTLGVLPSQAIVTPLPSRRFGEHRPAGMKPRHPTRDHWPTFRPDLRPPSVTPPQVASGPEPPSIGDTNEPGGPGIPGGFDSGERPIEVERPRPPQQNKPLKMSEGVMDAMLVQRVEPDYPKLALTIHLSGTVVLRARIGTNGEVRDLETVSGNPLLADAARRAVSQWRYRPTMLNGQAVEVETQITVNFVLNAE